MKAIRTLHRFWNRRLARKAGATWAGALLAVVTQCGALTLADAAQHGAAAQASLGGVYVVLPTNTVIKGGVGKIVQSMASSNIDGVYVRSLWATVEPTRGTFDWSYFDQQVASAAALGKKVALGIDAGQSTPAWLYAEGAQGFNTVVEIPRQADFCNPITLPVPWDPTFLAEHDRLVAAFGARYANNPAVSMIKLTGIAYRTDETSLPSSKGGTATGLAIANYRICRYPDDLAQWQSLGYTSQKITAAFIHILSSYGAAFPRQALTMISNMGSLPPLGVNGVADSNAAQLVETAFIALGRGMVGNRLVMQANNMRSDQVDAGLMTYHGSSRIGFQEAWPVTGDSTCIMNGGVAPCDPATVFHNTLSNIVNTKATYIEIFKEDATNPLFAADLQAIHKHLAN